MTTLEQKDAYICYNGADLDFVRSLAEQVESETIDGSREGFEIDPDVPFGRYVSSMADRIQTVVMEGRQQMVPGCPPRSIPLRIPCRAAW